MNLRIGSILVIISISGLISSCVNFHSPLSRELNSGTRAPAYAVQTQELQNQEVNAPHAGKAFPNIGFFDWPVDMARMTRGFLPNQRKPHLGVDLAAIKGTPIFASHIGTVLYTGKDFHGFGKMIIIESENGWATLYAHLEKIYVTEGQKVKQGEYIASMGRTGRATGVHLHFEIRNKREPVDPLEFLPKIKNVAGN